MRSLASYILAALLIGIALNFAAPASSVGGASAKSWPSMDDGVGQQTVNRQIVNRDAKSDRLQLLGQSSRNIQTQTVREIVPAAPRGHSVLDGCDGAFSPLSASARLNYSSRCVS